MEKICSQERVYDELGWHRVRGLLYTKTRAQGVAKQSPLSAPIGVIFMNLSMSLNRSMNMDKYVCPRLLKPVERSVYYMFPLAYVKDMNFAKSSTNEHSFMKWCLCPKCALLKVRLRGIFSKRNHKLKRDEIFIYLE